MRTDFTKTILALLGLLLFANLATAQVNMNNYITLTGENGKGIGIELWHEGGWYNGPEEIPVRIESGNNVYEGMVGDYSAYFTCFFDGTVMNIYGDYTMFRCNFECDENQYPYCHITDMSIVRNESVNENHFLEVYAYRGGGYPRWEKLNTLNISGSASGWLRVDCYDNEQLATINAAGCTTLAIMNCSSCAVSSLNVTGCTRLRDLNCSANQLTDLDISGCTALGGLDCSNNQLTALDISGCMALGGLNCYGNNLSTEALDDIYCALPPRQQVDEARIVPAADASDPNLASVLASNAENAAAKGWRVTYANETPISTTGSYACSYPVNMERYLTLAVQEAAEIQLSFMASDVAYIKVESGDKTYVKGLAAGWSPDYTFLSGGTEMTVYGDIVGFSCAGNNANVTALDVSHNTALKVLKCYDNNMSTQALDDIYCGLPEREPGDGAVVYPAYTTSSSNHAAVLASNANNAIGKRWEVLYGKYETPISTTGSYECSVHLPEGSGAHIAVQVYPNPAGRTLTVEAEGRIEWLELYDAMGRKVLAESGFSGKTTVDFSGLKNGLYLLKVCSERGTAEYKVMRND